MLAAETWQQVEPIGSLACRTGSRGRSPTGSHLSRLSKQTGHRCVAWAQVLAPALQACLDLQDLTTCIDCQSCWGRTFILPRDSAKAQCVAE